jgi:hypothetical protein
VVVFVLRQLSNLVATICQRLKKIVVAVFIKVQPPLACIEKLSRALKR